MPEAPVSQQSLPDHGALPDPDAKRMARVSFALAPELKVALRDEAKRSGETTSTLMETLSRQRVGMLLASGKSGKRDPLLQSIDTLRAEAEAALSDGRVSAGERARLTALLSDQLHALWGNRRRA